MFTVPVEISAATSAIVLAVTGGPSIVSRLSGLDLQSTPLEGVVAVLLSPDVSAVALASHLTYR